MARELPWIIPRRGRPRRRNVRSDRYLVRDGSLLFISAYLLVGSFDRKGRQKFLKDRFVRIGIPLFGIVAFLLILTAAVGANPAISSFSWLFLITVEGANSATFSIGWLWFLVFLLILAVVYSVWRTLNITIRPVPCPGNGTLVTRGSGARCRELRRAPTVLAGSMAAVARGRTSARAALYALHGRRHPRVSQRVARDGFPLFSEYLGHYHRRRHLRNAGVSGLP